MALSPNAVPKLSRGVLSLFFVAVVSLVVTGDANLGWSAQSGPYSDSDLRSMATGNESKIQEIQQQEITQLRIALGRRLPVNRQADLYFRLAEIYLEAYRIVYLQEGRVHDRRLEKGSNERFINRSHSRAYAERGIQAAKQVLKFNIAYNKLDRVYYFLGFYNGEIGNKKESSKYYDLLAKKFPNSPVIAEAYRELGENAFDRRDYRKAKAYFENALRRDSGDSAVRIYHKLAWAHYRLRSYDRAVSTMKEAVSRATQSGEKFLSLREEALRDMAIFMTETGRVEEALNYFKSVAGDKDYFPKILETLGRQYERNVETQKAIQVYETLLAIHPEGDTAFRVFVKLVDLDLRKKHYKDALRRISKANIINDGDSETKTAYQNLKAMVRRTATEHHELYRKKHVRADLLIAEDFYESYLKYFLGKMDSRKETPEIQMYLAEVKRDVGKPKEASELYRKVLDSEDKRYAREAGTLWTASLAEAIKKVKPGSEPSAVEKDFVDAADAMQESLGNMPEGREAALKAAQVLAGYKSTQGEAIDRCRKIMKRSPKSTQALTAARLWIQLMGDRLPKVTSKDFNDSGAVDDLRDAIKETRENVELMAHDRDSGGGRLRQQLAEQESRFKVAAIAVQEKDQNYAGAGKSYESFAATAPTKEAGEKAFSSAVASYSKAGDFTAAEQAIHSWIRKYPNSTKPFEVARTVATEALIQGQFDHSAALFETLGKQKDESKAYEVAARIYEGNGNIVKAQVVLGDFIRRYPQSSDRWNVGLSLARMFETQGQLSDAAKTYRYCSASSAETAPECGARLGDILIRLKEMENAKETFGRVAAMKSKQNSPFVAYSRYRLAELIEAEPHFDPLRLPEKSLQRAMKQRLDFLERLSRSYQAAVQAGGPWAVAALDRLATWVLHLSEEVDQIAPAPGSTPAAAAQFKAGLKGVSDSLRKKAFDTWQDAFKKAADSELLSPVLPEIMDRLADLGREKRLPRAQGYRGRFRIVGLPADGGSEGTSAAFTRIRERLLKNPQDANAWLDYGNLIWGQGKPLLAKVAYDRSQSLNKKSPGALNNRAVVLLTSGANEEDWFIAAGANQLLREALSQDDLYLPAKINRATLLNYYRIFSKSRALWEQINVRAPGLDTHDGLGVALMGSGRFSESISEFSRAAEIGGNRSRFVDAYHDAVRMSLRPGVEGAEQCLSKLGSLSSSDLAGFEKQAVDHLQKTCEKWKTPGT